MFRGDPKRSSSRSRPRGLAPAGNLARYAMSCCCATCELWCYKGIQDVSCHLLLRRTVTQTFDQLFTSSVSALICITERRTEKPSFERTILKVANVVERGDLHPHGSGTYPLDTSLLCGLISHIRTIDSALQYRWQCWLPGRAGVGVF